MQKIEEYEDYNQFCKKMNGSIFLLTSFVWIIAYPGSDQPFRVYRKSFYTVVNQTKVCLTNQKHN